MLTPRTIAKATIRFIGATILCTSLIGCSTLLGPNVECHIETLPPASGTVTPPDSLHLPSVTISITQTKRVCTRV